MLTDILNRFQGDSGGGLDGLRVHAKLYHLLDDLKPAFGQSKFLSLFFTFCEALFFTFEEPLLVPEDAAALDLVVGVEIHLHAALVGEVLVGGHHGELGLPEELVEDGVVEVVGLGVVEVEAVEGVEPPSHRSAEVELGVVELGELHVIEGELVVRLLKPFLALVVDGLGGVIDGSVLEEGLPGVLHLDDELVVGGGVAIDVEIVGAGADDVADAFDVFVVEVGDGVVATDEGVEETDEEVLVLLGAEELLEAEIDEGVEVAFVHGFVF